ncbi:Trans-hexaprenyltranstransferase [Lentisphaera araneosa HTCC2155]|uniref:Trans-hexaprenyltranstransferase n=1 Tax=Lentisphaera araneosa HTCC2155 TaxID=313628 RepID=A6DRL9_9BACT|nr:polyprenyl synthetase family protein [Lentisphaera araneosa]EDM25688.1 Trans-hexaprenyltranstransferase [Lentisphaera araneosa HTCC2155]
MQSDTLKSLSQITGKYATSLEECNELIQDTLKSSAPQTSDLAITLKKSRGKQLRPLLVFTILGQQTSANKLAAVCESIHCASLVHDDIIDDCRLRRNLPTMNSIHDNSIALLLGDLMFTSIFTLSSCLPSWVTSESAQTIKTLIEGELLQQTYKCDIAVTKDQYLDVLQKKTGALLSFCTKAASRLADKNPDDVQLAGEYANTFGLIFQIADDWADFVKAGTEDNKDRGADIGNGFVTLPWILMLEHAPKELHEQLLELITSKQRCGMNHPLVKEIYALIQLDEKMQVEINSLEHQARQALESMSSAMPIDELEIYLNTALKTFKR